jgi:hypothetical protein
MAETPTTGDRRPKTDAARQRQRDGQYKGLLHAVQKRKADNSANYAPAFAHGQMAADFERSAEAAGENRQEVRGHLSLLDRTLLALCGFFSRIGKALPELKDLPQLPLRTDASSPRAPKLVRALGLLLWRPLRLYRMQENWERLAICYLLQRIIRWRKQHGELTAERVEKFHWDLNAILENYYWHINPRLKKIDKRFWKVWRVYRGLVGVVAAVVGVRDWVLGSRDSGFGFRGSAPHGDLGPEVRSSESGSGEASGPGDSQWSAAGDQRSALETRGWGDPGAESQDPNPDNRTPNPASPTPTPAPLVQFRGRPHYDQFHPNWLERLDDLSPEAIADPFQSPSTLRGRSKGARSRRG